MKLSKNTHAVLSNFASINNGLLVKPGSLIGTISPNKTILAFATAETFDQEFCIYDLSQFLGTLSLFDDPELTFHEKTVVIVEGAAAINYTYADPNTIVTVPDKKLTCDPDVSFEVSADILSQVFRGASVLALPNVIFEPNGGGGVAVSAIDVKDSSSNRLCVDIPAEDCTVVPDHEFKMVFKVENLKLMAGTYNVMISQKGIGHFSTEGLEYFIAVDQADSSFK